MNAKNTKERVKYDKGARQERKHEVRSFGSWRVRSSWKNMEVRTTKRKWKTDTSVDNILDKYGERQVRTYFNRDENRCAKQTTETRYEGSVDKSNTEQVWAQRILNREEPNKGRTRQNTFARRPISSTVWKIGEINMRTKACNKKGKSWSEILCEQK